MIIDPDPDGIHRRRLAGRRRRGAHGGPRRRRWWPRLLGLLVFVIALPPAAVWALRTVDPPTTAFMLAARWSAYARGDGTFSIDQRWRPFAAISGWAGVAAIAAEDQKFPRHHGFDVEAIAEAWQHNQDGGALRGASTISQQLAKNLFLWSGRSFARKGLEAGFTFLLEAMLSKTRILELYLNVAEFGPGVYGVGAASERYFGHAAAGLDESEAALLAAVLPNPREYHVEAPSPYVLERRQWIRRQMQQLGGLALLSRLSR